jgi:electron transport complex protein RnfD
MISWASHMTGWLRPIDLATAATPLSGASTSFMNLFIGAIPGSLGETSAFALLLGAAWLFYKGHIDWRIPGGYIGTVFLLGILLDGRGSMIATGLFHVLAGGVMLGALFMATDMVTSPVTPRGQLIFGIGCGLITMLVRLYGNYPEGVTYAILLMNAVTPLIDNYTLPRKFGEVAN